MVLKRQTEVSETFSLLFYHKTISLWIVLSKEEKKVCHYIMCEHVINCVCYCCVIIGLKITENIVILYVK